MDFGAKFRPLPHKICNRCRYIDDFFRALNGGYTCNKIGRVLMNLLNVEDTRDISNARLAENLIIFPLESCLVYINEMISKIVFYHKPS